jgi:transcriptional regulator with XRE-family HTH domain
VSTEEQYQQELAKLRQGLADNVRRLRTGSQTDLADAANLHRTQVGDIEQGKRNPRLHTLLILADAMGLTLNDLVEGLPVPKERQPSPQARRAANANASTSASAKPKR